MAARRPFSMEFNVEVVRLVRERGVSMAQAARDLDVHVNVLRGGYASPARIPPTRFRAMARRRPRRWRSRSSSAKSLG